MQITSLQLPPDLAKTYGISNENREFGPLSKVNIFVGPNNCGKSRFLRQILKEKKLTFRSSDIPLEEANRLLSELKREVVAVLKGNNLTIVDDISTSSIPKDLYFVEEGADFLLPLRNLFTKMDGAIGSNPQYSNTRIRNSSSGSIAAHHFRTTAKAKIELLNKLNVNNESIVSSCCVMPTNGVPC